MVQIIGELIMSFLSGLIVVVVGMHFRVHCHTSMGKNGIVVPSAKANEYKWIYAQAIGPRVMITFGLTAMVVSLFINGLLLLFGYDSEAAMYLGLAMGGIAVVAALIFIDWKVSNFNPIWLSEDDSTRKEQWLNTMKEYAEKKQFVLFERLAESEA